ncbi:hypothetical protein [Planctomicrobium sp. SH664]|uniref:hypothetical protein n=1 Tax=Planctomicrobium sp. SH664 TaxID=3448125 RepID=UPI003F5B05F0
MWNLVDLFFCLFLVQVDSMLPEASQSTMRVLALFAATAFFAGLWNGDQQETARPRPAMAGWIPYAPRDVSGPQLAVQDRTDGLVAPLMEIRRGAQTRTFSVEPDELSLTSAEISDHLAQLPIGLAAGDYRIVDDRGGVGWLRVRVNATGDVPDRGEGLLTTHSGGTGLKFLRVKPEEIGFTPALIR